MTFLNAMFLIKINSTSTILQKLKNFKSNNIIKYRYLVNSDIVKIIFSYAMILYNCI